MSENGEKANRMMQPHLQGIHSFATKARRGEDCWSAPGAGSGGKVLVLGVKVLVLGGEGTGPCPAQQEKSHGSLLGPGTPVLG